MIARQLSEAELDGPALAPPNGVIPDFDRPGHRNTAGYTVLCIYLVVATVSICLRLYTQLVRLRNFHFEDFLGLAAYGIFVAVIALNFSVLIFPGFYVHQWEIRLRDMPRHLFNNHIGAILYYCQMGCVKAAIVLSWLRIFNPMKLSRTFLWTCHIVLWLNVLYYISSLVVVNTRCIPIAKKWDPTIVGGHCISDKATYLGHPIFNLVSDIVILILPQKIIWRLQIPKTKRLAVSSMFGVGGVCCIIIGCYRLLYTANLDQQKDRVYEKGTNVFLVGGEMLLVQLVFCIPAFPKAFKREKEIELEPIRNKDRRGVDGCTNGLSAWPRKLTTNPDTVTQSRDGNSLDTLEPLVPDLVTDVRILRYD